MKREARWKKEMEMEARLQEEERNARKLSNGSGYAVPNGNGNRTGVPMQFHGVNGKHNGGEQHYERRTDVNQIL